MLKLLVGLTILYGLALVGGFALQRRLLYLIDPVHVSPSEAGLPGVTELTIVAPDGVQVIAWSSKAQPGQRTLLYFHGNAGALADRRPRFERFTGEGWGVFMMTYRGYGGSSGMPTETDNIADAIRAFDRLVSLGVRPDEIVLYGESLGTGVASQVALARRPAGLILDAPFTSIPDVAKRRFWYVPVRLIMRDRYETKTIIGKIGVPLLIIHGTQDETVPIEMGRRLAQLAHEPKTFVELPNAGHSNLYIDGNDALGAVRSFINGLPPTTAGRPTL